MTRALRCFTFAYANCTFDCVIRPTRQMCRPLGELSTSDLWRLIRQRQRQRQRQWQRQRRRQRSRRRRMRRDGKCNNNKDDVCGEPPFSFSVLQCFGARVLRSNFPPDDSRHASPHSLSGQITQIFRRIALSALSRRTRRVSLIRAERTFAYNIYILSNTHTHTHLC